MGTSLKNVLKTNTNENISPFNYNIPSDFVKNVKHTFRI